MDNLNNLYVSVRERIFAQLKSKSIQQKDFAKAIGVNAVTITDWKKGKSFSFMKKISPIAEALGTSEVWLLTGKYISQTPGTVETMEEIAGFEGVHLLDLIGIGKKFDQYSIKAENITRKDSQEVTPEDQEAVRERISEDARVAFDGVNYSDKEEMLREALGIPTEEKPTPVSGDGLTERAIRLDAWFQSLPPETRKAILTLGGGPEDLAE